MQAGRPSRPDPHSSICSINSCLLTPSTTTDTPQAGSKTPYIPGKAPLAVRLRVQELLSDPMVIDEAVPVALNTAIARYLCAHITASLPRNWGIDQLTILTNAYEATNGLKSNMKSFYKTMHAKTGTNYHPIRDYLCTIRKQSVDSETNDATAHTVATHFYRENQSWTKNEDEELIAKHGVTNVGTTNPTQLVKDITINTRSWVSIEKRITQLTKLGRLTLPKRNLHQQLAIDLTNQLERQYTHPANDGQSLKQALRATMATDDTHTRNAKRRALQAHPMKHVAQQALLCNYSLPVQRLSYDTKTALLTPSQRDPHTSGQPDAIGPTLPGPLPSHAAIDLYKRL